jgi:hypothetical protein
LLQPPTTTLGHILDGLKGLSCVWHACQCSIVLGEENKQVKDMDKKKISPNKVQKGLKDDL